MKDKYLPSWFFCLKNKVPDSRTISPPAHTVVTILTTATPSPPHASKSHPERERHKTQMEHVDVPKGLIPLCSGWRGKELEEAIAIDDFLFMVKFLDSCLKIQSTLAFYSVGIDLLFFPFEKKTEYILLVTGKCIKIHFLMNSHIKETGFEQVSLMHGTYKFFHNQ